MAVLSMEQPRPLLVVVNLQKTTVFCVSKGRVGVEPTWSHLQRILRPRRPFTHRTTGNLEARQRAEGLLHNPSIISSHGQRDKLSTDSIFR